MRPKFFQSLRNYIQLSLAVLSICLSALAVRTQPLNTIAAPNPVSPISAVGKPGSATGLARQGKNFYAAGKFSDAASVWQLAAQAFQSQGDRLNQATSLNYLSLAYQQLGQWSKATKAIAHSLQILQSGQDADSKEELKILAQARNIQGQMQLAQGRAEQALATWQQATTTYTQAGDQIGVIGSSINQAQALQALGLYRRTLVTLNEVHQTLRSTPDSPLKVAGLRSLGNALRMVGDLDQSRQILQQSLASAVQLQLPIDVGATLFSLGNTARVQQDTKAALSFYQQAAIASSSQTTKIQAQLNQLSLLLETEQWSAVQALLPQIQSQLTTLPPSRAAVYAQINFAQSLTRIRQPASIATPKLPEIAQLLAKAVQQAKSLGDSRAEAYALGNLGGLYEQTRQWSSAQDLTRQALLLAQGINASDIAYRFSWQLGRLLKAQGNTPGAITTYTEAVSTLQSLRRDLVGINPEIQFNFRDEVEPVYRQLVDLLLQSEGGSQPSQQNLIQARSVIESLQLAELDNFFRVACLQEKPVQIDSVIDKDDPTAAVIYPIILADRLEVILKLPQQPLLHYKIAVAQGELAKTLGELREKLIKPYTLRETRSLSKQVYNWLLRPAEVDLAKSRVKTLVFVLDGPLRNIPMAALYDGQQYLVQKYAIALTPGLQLLAPKPIERGQLKALTGGLTLARQGFSSLTNVALELNQIKSEIPSTVLLNQEFTSTTLQNEINSVPFPVVHLATHGQFSSQAEQTFILAWDKPISVNELDGLLRSRDNSISNAIELLVLSACQTAAGDKRAALGLAGVAVRAGARSTLASLWNVNDRSTALLMGKFYRELGNNQLNKAEALRQAQLVLLNNPKYQRPIFWAPYVLVGNWL